MFNKKSKKIYFQNKTSSIKKATSFEVAFKFMLKTISHYPHSLLEEQYLYFLRYHTLMVSR